MTMAEDKTKEPGNWELYRGIERVEAAIHEMSKSSVSQAVWAVEKNAIEGKITDLQKGDVEQKAALLAADSRLEEHRRQQEAQSSTNRRFIYGMFLGPVISVAAIWVLSGGLVNFPT